nr:MAG TPA: hypothetical protein [Caudoviricetes sp.]
MQLRTIPQPLPFHGIPCKPIRNFRNAIRYQTAMLSHVLANHHEYKFFTVISACNISMTGSQAPYGLTESG